MQPVTASKLVPMGNRRPRPVARVRTDSKLAHTDSKLAHMDSSPALPVDNPQGTAELRLEVHPLTGNRQQLQGSVLLLVTDRLVLRDMAARKPVNRPAHMVNRRRQEVSRLALTVSKLPRAVNRPVLMVEEKNHKENFRVFSAMRGCKTYIDLAI